MVTCKNSVTRHWVVWTFLLSLTLLAACGGSNDDGDSMNSDSDSPLDGDDDALENESEGDDGPQTIFAAYTEDEKTVDYVDLPRYLGKWYEIATYTIGFQAGCTGSTATYALREDNDVSVTNECFLESLDGEYKVDTARAEIVNADTNAELVVYFTEQIGADYWIIELDGQETEDPYEWAVVGSSLSIFLWVLSRTPQMDDDRLDLIIDRLEARGYDTESLDFTLQAEE